MIHRSLRPIAVFLFCLATSTFLGCGSAPAEAPVAAATPPAAASQATPDESPFPVPVVELSGSAQRLGTEHGRVLGGTIRQLHGEYLQAYFTNPGRRMMAMAAAAAFEPKVSPEHLAEVNALAASAGIEARQMLLAQCFLDLSAMTACSTVTLPATASPDGIARFGRNLDFPSFDVADKQTVVLIYRPDDAHPAPAPAAGSASSPQIEPTAPAPSTLHTPLSTQQKRHAFAAVSWPGMVGVLSGMNEHGLALANMEVKRSMRLPAAMPYILLYRTVLERCTTVNEAIALLERTPRQTANNLMLMDAAGDRAVVEITPEKVHVRRPAPEQPLISTNHPRGDQSWDSPGRCRRYDSIAAATQQQYGRIDVPAIEKMLADASQGDKTLQSMVFEPSTRTLYLSAGANAARGTFHKLDLKPLFAGK